MSMIFVVFITLSPISDTIIEENDEANGDNSENSIN